MPLRTKLAWVALLYFVQGFPFGVVYDLLPVYFRSFGVSLTDIGMLSFLGLPWTLKVFWSPLVDRFGTRQQWIVSALLGMAGVLFLLPLQDVSDIGIVIFGLLLVFTTLSATQDIAIDAYTIGILDKGEEGPANSFRVSAFRVAMIAAGGGLVVLATWLSWTWILWMAAVLCAVLAVVVRASPRVQIPPEARQKMWQALWAWVARPGGWAVLLFILMYKVGDAAMAPMLKPFWVDRGFTPAQIGTVSTTVGILATIVGAMIGGVWVRRIGIFHSLWVLGLIQAVTNLGYAGAAAVDSGTWTIYAVSVLESFAGGLGTAAFLSFLMNVCEKERAAVQYALLSAIFGLSRSISGGFSGVLAEELGYSTYFGATFLLALPAFVLLPQVRKWIREAAPA